MKRAERIQQFVDEIWSWYGRHKRTLPWRDLPDRDPTVRAYKILVSEVMLQQTQVPRVIGAYKEFLRRFPTLSDLAAASNRDVILAWRGMGYNNRALRLRDAAKIIVASITFPQTVQELCKVPGIGQYTAAAVLNFAFNISTPCIDTNLRRVVHRTFFGPENPDGTFPVPDTTLMPIVEQAFHRWAAQGHVPRDFPAALMDFGSLVQTKRNPRWDICPLTAAGVMKTTQKNFLILQSRGPKSAVRSPKAEPGRIIGSRFIPNRIIRGRIIDELREAVRPLTLSELGKRVCIDWSTKEHRVWMQGILKTLDRDALITQRGKGFALRE